MVIVGALVPTGEGEVGPLVPTGALEVGPLVPTGAIEVGPLAEETKVGCVVSLVVMLKTVGIAETEGCGDVVGLGVGGWVGRGAPGLNKPI